MDQRGGFSYSIWIDVAGTPTILAGQDGVDVNGSLTAIDVTAKSDYPNRKFISGFFSGTLTLNSAYLASDAAFSVLQAANENGSEVQVTEYLDGTAERECAALVTAFNHSHPIDGKATVSVTLQITGGWTAV